jgi:hypothetical protein
MNTLREVTTRPVELVVVLALAFTAVFGVSYATAGPEEGCCGWKDCGVLPQPYEPCEGFGNPCSTHKDSFCCDTGGWCG